MKISLRLLMDQENEDEPEDVLHDCPHCTDWRPRLMWRAGRQVLDTPDCPHCTLGLMTTDQLERYRLTHPTR